MNWKFQYSIPHIIQIYSNILIIDSAMYTFELIFRMTLHTHENGATIVLLGSDATTICMECQPECTHIIIV